jgi:hypothetical protein
MVDDLLGEDHAGDIALMLLPIFKEHTLHQLQQEEILVHSPNPHLQRHKEDKRETKRHTHTERVCEDK